MKICYFLLSQLIFSLIFIGGFSAPKANAASSEKKKSLFVYSSRKEHLVKPLFEAYEKETGVKINYITDKAGLLITRLENEKESSAADIFMTVDAGNLWHASERGIFKKVESETLNKNIPTHLRDPNGQWYGFTVRARAFVYNTDKVSATEIESYEALAEKRWKNRLCLRTSKKVYNQSLVATLIENLGEEKSLNVVKGWVKNLAQPVFSSDTDVIKAVAAGNCSIGVVNSYYFGRYLAKQKTPPPVAIFWPNQKTQGVHVNISGAGVVKYSKNQAEALKFLEWLSQSDAQKTLAEMNHEFPANPKIPSSDLVRSWGEFKQDSTNVHHAGRNQVRAIKLMDSAGYL